jgi:acetoin utilization deacetylase AcuC-like enzyme
MTVALITHAECQLHDMGPHHPESPARLQAIHDQLVASGLEWIMPHFDAPEATHEQLLRVHSELYIRSIFEASPAEGHVHLDIDNVMNPHTLKAALHAAGAAVLGVDLVMRDEVEDVFCAVRPPGHHAERDRAMGFCFFNNVAVAAAHALEAHGLQRVAIVDFDVHHGNGTEHIFSDDQRVLFCSTFQHPFYPYSGSDSSNHHIINAPLAAGSDGSIFREAVEQYWLPALQDFKPQLILCSAGFDAHYEDDMASLRLNETDYQWVTSKIKAVAKQYAEGRVVSTLEGGYALSALGRSVVAHIKALLD